MTNLKIADKTIGPGEATLVIAEIGVNHDGSVERALELVEIASRCGADAVKLQIFRADVLMNPRAGFADYQKQRCAESDATAMLRRYELGVEELTTVVNEVRRHDMLPLATPFSPADVQAVEVLDLPAVKIASPDLVNRPLLARAAATRRPLLVSTGAATSEEVATTCQWLRHIRARFVLLHCVSSYPTPDESAHLCWISEMTRRHEALVGYSDHATDVMAGALAVAAGAVVVEKHLTYDCSAEGPDHAASADPEAFAQYVQFIRRAERLRGVPGKRVLEIEQDVRTVARQSLVLKRDAAAGEVLRENDLVVQRPGTGIPAGDIAAAVGRKFARPLRAGTLLQWDMLAA